MKPEKPLTDKELEKWENSRNLEAELLESVRQIATGKVRIVMLPAMPAQKINQRLTKD